MNSARISLLTALAFLLIASHADAAIWTVEKDGSGDFTIIQDAIDAAAPGDSILIGPGRFGTFRPANSTVDNIALMAIACVQTANLTIVGAGKDQTFLGPEGYAEEVDGLSACSLYLDGGCAGTIVSGVQLDNTYAKVTIRDQAVLEESRILRVVLQSVFAVTIADAPDVIIRTTEFIGTEMILTESGTERLIVEDCTFEDEAQLGAAIRIGNAAQDCIVRRCTMTVGGFGIKFELGGTGVVEDCKIFGMKAVGVWVSQGFAVVQRCHIGETRQGIRVTSGSAEVYDTIIDGGTQGSLITSGSILMRGCHILNVGGLSVRNRATGSEPVDVRHNWWGTADTLQIESWIDDPNGTAIWSPIADMPIPTEKKSMGEFKALHRN